MNGRRTAGGGSRDGFCGRTGCFRGRCGAQLSPASDPTASANAGHGAHEGVRDRVLELDAAGMETDAPVGVGAWRAVFQVALDGAADGGQLTADLVVASRVEADGQQGVAVGTSDEAVVEHGLLAAAHLGGVGKRLVEPLVTREPVGERGALGGGRAADDGQVGLAHAALAEEGVQPAERLAGPGEDHEPAHGAVEPVDNAEKDGAGLGVLFLDVGFHAVGEGGVAGLVALYDLAGLLVDDDEVVVFVNDVHLSVRVGWKNRPMRPGVRACARRRAAPAGVRWKPPGLTCSCRRRLG